MAIASMGSDNGLGFGLTFTLQDGFSSTAQSIQNEFNRMTLGANNMSNRIQNSFMRIHQASTMIDTAKSFIQPFLNAVQSFAEYDKMERGLTAIMGSARLAKDEFAKLREIAKDPGLGLMESVRASVGLQAAGASAELARKAIQGVGRAVGQIGEGKATLDGVMLQMRQMLSIGRIVSGDLKPIMSRIPQLGGMMQKVFGTASAEGIAKLGISAKEFIERISNELLTLPTASASLSNSFENLTDSLFILAKNIGEPLAPLFQTIADGISDMAGRIEKFAETGLGKVVIKGAAIIAGMSAFRLGLASVQAMLPEVIQKTGLFAPFLGGITATVKGLFSAMTGGFMAVGKSLFKFTSANLGTIALVALGVAIHQVMEGYDSFMNLVNGKSGVLTGFAGFLQRIGGYARGLWEVLNTVNSETFRLSEGTAQALQKLGIYETVLHFGSWAARLQQMWYGFSESLLKGFEMFKSVAAGLVTVLSYLGVNLKGNFDQLNKWKEMGRILGVVVIGALVGIAAGFLWAGLSAIVSGIGALIAWSPLIGMFLLIVAAIGLVGLAFYGIYLAAKWVFDKIVAVTIWWVNFWLKVGSMALEAGKNFVLNLWNGIKSIWNDLVQWVTNAWNKVTDTFTNLFSDSENNININKNISNANDGEFLQRNLETRSIIQNAPRPVYSINQEPLVLDKSTVNSVTVVNQIDGRDVSKAVYDVNELNAGRL